MTDVLSGYILIAGNIILVALVKKLRDSSNYVQNSNVYTPGTSYWQVPTESLRVLNSKCDYGTVHIYETVTENFSDFKATFMYLN